VMFPTFTKKCSLMFKEGLFPEILLVYYAEVQHDTQYNRRMTEGRLLGP